MTTKLLRIAEKARREPNFKFTSLFHLMNEDLLLSFFQRLRKDEAAGIDKMTKDMYAGNLNANLSDLIDRLHRMAYKPQSIRRKYIPKPGSTKNVPWEYRVLKINLFRRGLFVYWNPYTNKIS